MEHYKILGIDENASMEEVKRAYENKVNQFKEDIKDEKRLKSFIKEFNKAYEEIIKEREKGESIKPRTTNSRVRDSRQYSKNRDDYEEERIVRKGSGRQSSRNPSTKRRSNRNKQSRDNDKNYEKRIVKRRKESSSKGSAIQLPLKILALPVIFILSIVIFLCKIINAISWVASKVIIIAAISASAIHGYQIYIGHAVIYEVFIISAIAFIAALFLPSILKVVPSALGGINDRLKRFVF